MRKIRSQLILLFLVLQMLSMLLANGILYLFMQPQSEGVIRSDLDAQRLIALDLAKRTDLTAEEISEVLSTTSYMLRRATEEEQNALSENQMKRLQSGAILSHGEWSQFFILDGEVMLVEPYIGTSFMRYTLLRMALSSMFSTGIAILLVVLSSNWMVRPIRMLSEATQKIAAGDFEMRVNTDIRMPFGGSNEIGELMYNFNQMAEELGGVEYLRRDFTSSVSHELKTPVAAISGYARLLQDAHITPEERSEYTQAILTESKRLAGLSDNLLRLTRLESRQVRLSKEMFDLSEQLRQAIGAAYPVIEGKRIQINVELEPLSIISDEELLGQVWSNLLGNAIKFTPEGGAITVTLKAIRREVVVSISDTGVGIDEQLQKRIFEKFYQADASHSNEGSGLGLPLAKRIVDILGGRMEVTSAPGEGSTFTVTLMR